MNHEPHEPLTMAEGEEMAKQTTNYPEPYQLGLFDWLSFAGIGVLFMLAGFLLAKLIG